MTKNDELSLSLLALSLSKLLDEQVEVFIPDEEFSDVSNCLLLLLC